MHGLVRSWLNTHIRHQSLEAHVLDASNILCAFEVFASAILSSLSRVIHEVFCHLTEGATFFSEVDDDTAAAFLGLLDSLFDTKNQVWSASADVRTEDIASITLVVNSERQSYVRISHLCRITENVYSQSADGWEEELDVMAGDQLWVGATCFLEQSSAKRALI